MAQRILLSRKIFQGFLLLLACSLLTSCFFKKKDTAQGSAYKADLLQSIRQASKIVVTEHSSELDFVVVGRSIPQKERVYRTVTLSQRHRDNFISIVEATPDETQQSFSGCLFDPHHTVYFYVQGKLASKLDICFACGQQQWNATKHTPPSFIIGSFSSFVKSIGLSPEREWAELLKKKS
ncbi:hypothetical protein ACO0LF_18535 [Undibacterium sp. Di27W]|uniref:hypothetical protein n=1 Tax=Undibacterium sp. Di27W TaxID=3413036 RepID=UPI003BEF705B